MTSIAKNFKTGGFDVRNEEGELLANYPTYWAANAHADEIENPDGLPEEELTAEQEAEIERENLIDDLCSEYDPSDLAEMSTRELRKLFAAL
ncbi:hypothetical protein V5E97_06875 [Singulisphaera sp. Ch08]|uniref:Uncharacterized protein n=1 Tax=Singulisphaera sp. Ch08 TaxID=3120278 RepID=A0AAU7CKU2_9BACT